MVRVIYTVTMRQWRHLGSLILTAMIGSGCCHLPSFSNSGKRPHLPASMAAEFDYPRAKEVAVREKESETNHKYSVKRIQFASASSALRPNETNRTLVLDYFLPATKEKHPVLLILPIQT